MFAGVAALLGFCVILFVAAQGLIPGALIKQRIYAGATGAWTVFGVVLYHPAGMMRWIPHIVTSNTMAQGIFAFGLMVIAIAGVSLLMGND